MPEESVSFKKTTQAVFDELEVNTPSFFRVEKTNGSEDIYYKKQKLNYNSPYSLDNDGYLQCDYANL